MSLELKIAALATAIGTDIKALKSADGTLSTLTTTAKTNLVSALNELHALILAVDLSALINDTTPGTASTYSSTKIESLVSTAVAAVVDSSPAALDTLNELAAALGNDANFATTISTSLGNRVRVDDVQTFTGPEQAQGRANIGAASASDLSALVTAVGNTEADFEATYVAARDAV